jgi:hypothetical protein
MTKEKTEIPDIGLIELEEDRTENREQILVDTFRQRFPKKNTLR